MDDGRQNNLQEQTEGKETKKVRKPTLLRRLLKTLGIIVLIPITLFVLLAVLIYLPPIQNWVVDKVATMASEQTAMNISIDHVCLSFPLDLCVEGIEVTKPNADDNTLTDTIADIDEVIVDVRLLPLFSLQVEVDALEINQARLNTADLIAAAHIKGSLERLYVNSHGIDLNNETVRVNLAEISDADLCIELLNDTTAADTTESENFWKIDIDRAALERTSVTLLMQGDTLQIGAYMDCLAATDAHLDLHKGLYKVAKVEWIAGRASYDNNYEPMLDGIDYNHLSVTDVNIAVDSIVYCDPDISLRVSRCSFAEKSGLTIETLTTSFAMDSTSIYLPDVLLRTSASSIDAAYTMNLNAFDDTAPGIFSLNANASIGKQDLMLFLADMPETFKQQWPYIPLEVSADISGNLQNIDIAELTAEVPTAFNINAAGTLGNITDTDNLTADIDIDATTYNIGFVTAISPDIAAAGVTMPANMRLTGDITACGSLYSADITLIEDGGTLKADASIDINAMRYTAQIDAGGVHLGHFLPYYGLGDFTGNINIKGIGTDITTRSTDIDLAATINALGYGDYNLDNMQITADVSGGKVYAGITSDNPLLKGEITLSALLQAGDRKGTPLQAGERMKATLAADVVQLDMYNLYITEHPMTLALCGHLDIESDMEESHTLQGSIGDITIRTADNAFRPTDINIDLQTSPDTTIAHINTGDFRADLSAGGGYAYLIDCFSDVANRISTDLTEKKIDYVGLRELMPLMSLDISSGQENPVYRFIEQQGYSFSDADISLRSSPERGLGGRVCVNSLSTDSMLIDTLELRLHTGETGLRFRAHARNNKDNPQYVFNAFVDGELQEHGASMSVRYYDANDELGLKMGLAANMNDEGIRINMTDNSPVLGYKAFSVNDDNYILLGSDRRISAKLYMHADDGQGLQLYSNDDNTEALQDLTVSLQRLNLDNIMSVLPYMPSITGTLDGDVNLVLTEENLTVAASIAVDEMTYEGCAMGDIATDFVYMPLENGSHRVNGTIMSNGDEVATIDGTYNPEGEGTIDAYLTTSRFPLEIANGFIPDRIVGFRGYCNGDATIIGSLSSPQIDGELNLDSCYLFSAPYGVELRFSDTPISIKESKLAMENFEMYANNNNPLTINGNVDFSNLDRMTIDMVVRAENLQVIDAKENAESVAYGKAFVNLFCMLQGPFESMTMRGKIDVLGTTDMAYILRDSPLTTDNQLEGLVTFVDFTDTLQTVVTRPVPSGFDMDMTIAIDQGAHIVAYLNTDHTNYVDLMGGGDLRMTYDASGDLSLVGTYSLSNGEMKYALPIIPLKTFTIQDGSYIEFTGPVMNPKLNITATEQVKTTVSSDGSDARMVEFECGVIITKTLSDMGLEFTLDAPEDMTLHNELSSMSIEQRGKLAVTMLTTGMYLADGNTSGFSMNNALSSFLQNEISNLTGNALRTLDLSFGMDNATDASGNTHTDYSFKFAKRFWNNRLNIIIGGKVTSGENASDRNDSFLDNVTFEYRLDNTSNKYVKVFYDNNAYDYLEGNTSEYGVGFIWRRSLQHFNDIFKFK